MTADEIEERVLEIVQDDSFEGEVLPHINRGITWLAGKFQLASLDATDTVSCLATEDHVSLPEDYMHGVYWVGKDGVRIGDPNFYNQFARFQRYNQDLTQVGSIHDVAVKGTSLYYASRETATLNIRYFCTPEILSSGSDIPEFLPEYLHEPLLANFAAWKIYDLIEDGIEDPKTNTKVYKAAFLEYLPDLEMYLLDTAGPAYVQDESERIW